jgi:predicted negative regulator of RcsB-dependent stress response
MVGRASSRADVRQTVFAAREDARPTTLNHWQSLRRKISGLPSGGLRGKLPTFMDTKELTASDYLFRLWPWIEDNLKRIAIGVGAVAILVFIYSFHSSSSSQKEITAGRALTQVIVSSSTSQQADAYLKIAADYPGTLAGQRALLDGAATLFTAGKFPEAQAQFQKFLDTYADSSFAPQALLGVAASLDAQGKSADAISVYQKVAGQGSDMSVTASAKFAIAGIYAAQGKTADAMKIYEEIARAYPNSSSGNEAGLRAMELKTKSPATAAKPATAAAAPFTLTH